MYGGSVESPGWIHDPECKAKWGMPCTCEPEPVATGLEQEGREMPVFVPVADEEPGIDAATADAITVLRTSPPPRKRAVEAVVEVKPSEVGGTPE